MIDTLTYRLFMALGKPPAYGIETASRHATLLLRRVVCRDFFMQQLLFFVRIIYYMFYDSFNKKDLSNIKKHLNFFKNMLQ